MSKASRWEIENSIRAGLPLLYIVTWEEDRAIRDMVSIGRELGTPVYTWSITQGLRNFTSSCINSSPYLRDGLKSAREIKGKAVVVFKDAHLDFADPLAVRQLRDLTGEFRAGGKTAIILSPVLKLPPELEKEATVIDYQLPDPAELSAAVHNFVNSVGRAAGVRLEPDQIEEFALAARGLTLQELESIMAKSLVDKGTISLEAITAQKEQVIRKTGFLEYYHSPARLGDVGGLGELKQWLRQRAKCFSAGARRFGLPYPKGVLLIGVQGCGKSLCAKAVAREWSLPLLRLDLGKVYSSYIGSSEDNIRRVAQICESVAPVVLWLDEIEKGFSGLASSGVCDSGTTARVIGSFLSWLQEKAAPVFVVATANDIAQLPPELLRKGRFDETFFLDLPDNQERKEIWQIHLAKVGRDPNAFDLDQLAKASPQMSGAEIEQAIASGLYVAFDAEEADLTTERLLSELAATVPLSQTMAEEVSRLRSWAEQRARWAS